jgi:hypothetical protein
MTDNPVARAYHKINEMKELVDQLTDPVNHPPHYGSSRFGIECIEFSRYMTFPAGNAFKYVWRHADKGNPVQDLEKALVYLDWALDDYANGYTNPVLPDYEQHVRIMAEKYLTGTENTVYAALNFIWDGALWSAADCVKRELERLR